MSVPRDDFNWQLTYYPDEPLELSVGTVLEGLAHFDNSSGNRHNPPLSSPVRGGQSWEEMMVGFFTVEMDPATDPESAFGRRKEVGRGRERSLPRPGRVR